VGGLYNQNGGTPYPREVLQQIIHSKRRVGKTQGKVGRWSER